VRRPAACEPATCCDLRLSAVLAGVDEADALALVTEAGFLPLAVLALVLVVDLDNARVPVRCVVASAKSHDLSAGRLNWRWTPKLPHRNL
jgi:hypothetical protein